MARTLVVALTVALLAVPTAAQPPDPAAVPARADAAAAAGDHAAAARLYKEAHQKGLFVRPEPQQRAVLEKLLAAATAAKSLGHVSYAREQLVPRLMPGAPLPEAFWTAFDAAVAAQRDERKAGPAKLVLERQEEFLRTWTYTFRERVDFASMSRIQAEVAAVAAERYGPADWRAADARREIARLTRLAEMPAADRALLARAEVYENPAPDQRALVADARRRAFGDTHPDHALSLTTTGLAAREAGDLPAAGRAFAQAYRVRRDALGADHPLTVLTLNYLGQVQFELGEYAAALTSLRAAVAGLGKVLDHRHPAYRIALNNLAVVLQRTGDHATAATHLRDAYAAFERDTADDQPARYARLGELPLLTLALAGDTSWSGNLNLRATFAPLMSDRPERARLLNNLARADMAGQDFVAAAGKLGEARALYAAMAADPKAQGYYPPKDHAACLNNLGLVQVFKKELGPARAVFAEAAAIREKEYKGAGPGFAVGLTSLAFAHAAAGDLDGARPLLVRAIGVLEADPGPTSLAFADATANLALIDAARGDKAAAAVALRRVVRAAADQLAGSAVAQSEREQLGRLTALRGHLDAYLAVGLDAGRPADELYEPVLVWKGSVFARQKRLRERKAVAAAGGDAARVLAELEDAVRRYATVAGRHVRYPTPATLTEMAALGRRREELEQALATASPEVRGRRAAEAASPAAVRDALPADAALIDLLEYSPPDLDPSARPPRRLLAFVVRHGRPVAVVALGPAGPVADAVDRWRAAAGRDPGGTGAELRRLLWEPVAAHLDGVRTVLVSPDGPTTRFPFSALPGDAPGSYLIEERAVAVVPVPRELAAPRPAAAGAAELLVVGGVEFGTGPGKWAGLPGTVVEADAVRREFDRANRGGRVRDLRGDAATEGAARAAAGARWVHVASHGFFAPAAQPSGLAPGGRGAAPAPEVHPGVLSGLVLAGANRAPGPGEDDGVLTALEVADLDLSGCELAVLSACETGLGATAGGEGVLGLQRAFQVAGARATVTSLWKVPDRATAALMSRFYANLWDRKMGRLAALREAQLWLLREGAADPGLLRGATADVDVMPPAAGGRTPPYFWAAFTLSGDWR